MLLSIYIKEVFCMSNTIDHYVKDPGSAITHFIGMLMAIFAAVPLIIKAAHEPRALLIILSTALKK